LFKKPGIEDKKMLILTRCVTIPVMLSGLLLGAAIPRPGIYLVLAFDIVFAGLWAPLTLGLFWKKANWPAAITSIVVGSSLRLILYYITPPELAGIDTFIPPIVSFVLFIIVALLTQKKDPGYKRSGVVDYVPPTSEK
jgi:Na+/proline symporter